MTGQVTADLSTMPLVNLIAIILGIVLLVVIAAIIVKKTGVSIGNVKAGTYEYDQWCLTVNHHINEEIKTIDFDLHRDLRRKTTFTYHVSKLIDTNGTCPSVRRALYSAIKEPFYDCITENHFTRELSPENYESYKDHILQAVKESYLNILFETRGDGCDKSYIDEWELVEDSCKKMIEEWLIMVMREVKKACNRKIQVYETEGKNAEKSKHWNAIFTECIAKNKTYIKNMDDRLKILGVDG